MPAFLQKSGAYFSKVASKVISAFNTRDTGHPVIQSFEPGEDWFWDFEKQDGFEGPELAAPTEHPADQTVPGPEDRVPDDWRDHIH